MFILDNESIHLNYKYNVPVTLKLQKTLSVLYLELETKLKKECYLIRQDNTILIFSIHLSFLSIGQDKSKLQKQIIKLFINNNGIYSDGRVSYFLCSGCD